MNTITRILVLLPLLIAKLWTAELHWKNQHSKLTLTPKQTTGTISFKARNLSQELVEIDRVQAVVDARYPTSQIDALSQAKRQKWSLNSQKRS